MPRPSLKPTFASPSDLAACRDSLHNGSRSFFAASLLLPRDVRDPATALYAFCRMADDAIDLEGADDGALSALRIRMARAYEGRPLPYAVDRAFADVVTQFAIPRALPEALLEGIEWDARGRRYEDILGLRAYAARVAGAVGAMMAILMGARRPEQIARACDLGVAMQLTNIARDVGEDARAGRLYLPLAWLREAGIDPDAWLAEPAFDEALGSVVQRLLREADRLYARSDAGIRRLPRACRPAIHLSRVLYAEIGREVERAGLDSMARRAVVPAWRKLWLLGQAVSLAALPRVPGAEPALSETRFLVDAVERWAPADARLASREPRPIAWWRLDDQFAWVIDLFVRLEQRESLAQLEGNT